MTFELEELRQRRSCEAKELHGSAKLYLIYFFTWLDVWSHLVAVMVAFWSTAYILVAYLVLHFAMAASRSAAPAPLTWLVPEGGSTLGTSGCYAYGFYAVSYALRVGCLLNLHPKGPGTYLARTSSSNRHDCEGLPFWLRRPWWSSEATCPVTPSSYNRCLENRPWWVAGACNYYSATKGTTFLGSESSGWVGELAIRILMTPFYALLLALLAWTCWALGRCLASCCQCCCRNAVQVESSQMLPVDHPQMKSREPPSNWSRAMVVKDISFFCLDVLFDLNGILTFVRTGNFYFAIFSFLVFAWSLGHQLATGGFGSFYQEARESVAEGCLTDGLRRLTLTEKSVEAPLQLLLQFFSFLYVSFDDLAVVTFAGSMLLSLYSVVDAAYVLMELNLLPSLQEVPLYSSTELQLGDGEASAK